MAKSSINFAKATGHSEAHNFREEEREPHYLLPKEHRLANEYWRHEKSAHQLFDEELAKSTRKGGRVPKFENSHWEAVLNLNKEHSMEDVQRVAKHIEEQMNITCTAITIHRDEGVVNERGVVQYNLHAHLNFQTYKDNKQNWRLQHVKHKLPQLQTDVAKLLNMERGKEKSTAKRLDHRQYKAVAKEREATLAKEADLKAEIAKLRATLKEQGGKREDYAKLEQANRELKAQLKDKTLTVEDLAKKIKSLERKNQNVGQENIRLTNESQYIKNKNTQLESTVEALKSKNKPLGEELHQKEPESDSRPNMSVLEQENEFDKIYQAHVGRELVYEKVQEKGIFGKKESYRSQHQAVIKDQRGFREQLTDLLNHGAKRIKEQYNNLKTEVVNLKERLLKSENENRIYKAVAEETQRVTQRYMRLADKERLGIITDKEQVEKLRCAEYLNKPFGKRMGEELTARMVEENMIKEPRKTPWQARAERQKRQVDYELEQAKPKEDLHEKAWERVSERFSKMSKDEQIYANSWVMKNSIAKARNKPVPEYDYQAHKKQRGYDNQLNDVPEASNTPTAQKKRKQWVRQ